MLDHFKSPLFCSLIVCCFMIGFSIGLNSCRTQAPLVAVKTDTIDPTQDPSYVAPTTCETAYQNSKQFVIAPSAQAEMRYAMSCIENKGWTIRTVTFENGNGSYIIMGDK